ncbi:MAG: tRNA pseudouridine(13) synthase TruD [Phycisphaerales bacterium]|nr:tRNA pseudouridine(13) synthase TruD [Planctomycetota bacterium]MCH8508431.1 tRNA pseudouridine(13) synthase TruD [Phycisphaerales bacterium]
MPPAGEQTGFDAHVTAPGYLTADIPGIGGVIKQREEDFLVDEIPLYEPCGEGEHIYLYVEKRGLSTIQMRDELARHFRVSSRAIGHAGLKDKHAITRQVVSIHTPGKKPEDFPSFKHSRIDIQWADLHRNKLQRGHLAGNRFSIRVRDIEPTAAVHAQRALARLAKTGVPNRFGLQRFGYMRNNHLIGRAMILGDARGAMDLMLGTVSGAPPKQRDARLAYDAGDHGTAYELMPRVFKAERQALRVLARGGDHEAALRAIDQTAAGFFISSFQSAVFNGVLNRRINAGTLDRLVEGDLAFVIKSRAVFPVTPDNIGEAELAERLASFGVSPSGPMWGTTMRRAAGEIDRAEVDALRATGVTPEDLTACEQRDGYLMIGGDRRPLRIPVIDPEVEGGVDEHGAYVRCAFELPRGSFATTVMDEIMKVPLEEESDHE